MGDWTDRYGSGIAKALGGRIPFSLGSRDEIIETQSDIGNQIAYKPNSNKDKYLKSLFDMKSTYGETPAYRQELQKDWDNHIKTGEPLSLPKKEYSGVKGFTSLNNLGDNRYVHADNIKTDGIYTDSSNKGIESFLNIDNPLPYNELEEKPFSENYDYDKGTFLGIDGIEPNFLDIDGIEPQDNDWLRDNQYEGNSGNYITYEPQEAQTWLEKHNAAQRAYNDTTGLNTNYYAGSLHGNIDNAARVGRRNQSRIDNLLGDYIAGNNKMTSLGLKNRINQLGTQSQIDTFNQIQNQPSIDIRSEIVDDYGTGNTDVTAPTDSWSDTGGTGVSGFSDDDGWGSYIARGGMVKDAPRYRYAEGGIVNLLPKGAW
jgi:hypothetical protein